MSRHKTRRKSATYRLIETKMSEPLASFVKRQRAKQLSWPRISVAIHETTGVEVTSESLRNWFSDIG